MEFSVNYFGTVLCLKLKVCFQSLQVLGISRSFWVNVCAIFSAGSNTVDASQTFEGFDDDDDDGLSRGRGKKSKRMACQCPNCIRGDGYVRNIVGMACEVLQLKEGWWVYC